MNMSGPVQANKASIPESPTTMRPLELDDDDFLQDAESISLGFGPIPNATNSTIADLRPAEATPPKPPRAMSQQQGNQMILLEAFPTVDIAVIKAVLTASRGRVEPAFNALLEMTDPDSVKKNEPQSPPQPPRPSVAVNSQLESDAIYARQLADHYQNVSAYEARTTNRQQSRVFPSRQRTLPAQRSPGQDPGPRGLDQGQNREYSFIDDELPALRDNLKKGFMETQTKVNGWIQNIKKRIDDTFDESDDRQQRQTDVRSQETSSWPVGPAHRSTDYHPYDADPPVLSDDFAGIQLADERDDTSLWAQKPLSNPKQTPSKPPTEECKVAFQEELDDLDVYNTTPPPLAQERSASKTAPTVAKSSKWQPLLTLNSHPVAENDPFSLGDSDDDRDRKPKPGGAQNNQNDSEHVGLATAEAMADTLVDTTSAIGLEGTPSKT